MVVKLLGTLMFGGYIAYMGWVVSVALRGGPNWRSGRPGDPVRFPQPVVIVSSVAAMASGLVLLAIVWLYFPSR